MFFDVATYIAVNRITVQCKASADRSRILSIPVPLFRNISRDITSFLQRKHLVRETLDPLSPNAFMICFCLKIVAMTVLQIQVRYL